MENSYGIGITNRYDLFYVDDEAGDPFEALSQLKQKTQKKISTPAAPQTVASENANPKQQNANSKNKVAEKENKSSQNKGTGNNENQHPNKLTNTKDKVVVPANKSQEGNQRGERRGIKETQKDNIRAPREENKTVNFDKNFDRPANKNYENREDRNNRRNREPTASFDDRAPRRQGQNAGRKFDGRGKREFDRQSGSDKSGVKAVDKRDGGGAHNWGSAKQDADDYTKLQDDHQDGELSGDDKLNSSTENKDEVPDQQENKQPIEEEVKEMTLDEWKAQKAAVRAKPQYNLRKAGEGEDSAQWEKMVALDKKKAENEGEDEEYEYDPSLYPQRVGRQKHVLDIEFNFNDGRRGGMLGRMRGRGGGKGPRNTGGRNREGGERRDNDRRGDNERRDNDRRDNDRRDNDRRDNDRRDNDRRDNDRRDNDRRDNDRRDNDRRDNDRRDNDRRDNDRRDNERRDNDRRDRAPPPVGDAAAASTGRKFSKQSDGLRSKHAAPKVDDERDFPSLG